MHRRPRHSSSESDFSEADISMVEMQPRYRQRTRQRSMSRPRPSDFQMPGAYDYLTSDNVLAPVPQPRAHRSASTGSRRRRDVSNPRTSPPTFVVGIDNNIRAGDANDSNRRPRDRLQQQNYTSEGNEDLRPYYRRHPSASVSRERAPAYRESPPRQRDYYDVILDQRLRDRNDTRQDLDLMRQQQKIARLKQELAWRRENHHLRHDSQQDYEIMKLQQEIVRLQRDFTRHNENHELRIPKQEEEKFYEDEISDRLRRLQRIERDQHLDEDKRQLEHNFKLEKLEEAERVSAEESRLQASLREERLRDLQKKMDEESETDRIRKQIRDEEAQNLLAKMERDKEENNFRQAAIDQYKWQEEQRIAAERQESERIENEHKQAIHEYKMQQIAMEKFERERQEKRNMEIAQIKKAALQEHQMEQLRLAEEARMEQERKDTEFRDRLKTQLGLTDEQVDHMINKKELPGEEQREKPLEGRATWIKVHRNHLLPETLMAYQLPWEWDDKHDSNYIIIKQWISEDFQEELFAHTRRIREGRLVTHRPITTTQLRIANGKKDRMYLVRKRTPAWRTYHATS